MIARCLPSGEQRAAMPFADPLGLNGYFMVPLEDEPSDPP
jgi:hypothetical protein